MTDVRVVIVDDHPIFRLGLAAALESLDGLTVVGRASSQEEAIEVVDRERPDVVVMDLDLGAGSGVEATRTITSSYPGIAVLVVTMLGDDDSLFASIRAGARGYVLKGADHEDVERAVRAVARGEVLFGADVATRAIALVGGAPVRPTAAFPVLTDREAEVLDLIARGYDNATIARRLVLSNKTIRNYVSGILAKLHASDRSALIVRAREAGMGSRDPDN